MPTVDLIRTRLPLVAAPMAGGPTTVALAAAVARAGAFPVLAGGYLGAAALRERIRELRSLGSPFGVALFVPSVAPVDREAVAAYARRIESEARAVGAGLGAVPERDDDGWSDKLALLVAEPVPVVSLTFGLPPVADIAALRRCGSRVLATVTSPAEAMLAEDAGVDGLVVQGAAAGGHSAAFEPSGTLARGGSATPTPTPTPTTPAEADATATAWLVRRVREASALPVIAAGGVDGPDAVRLLVAAGADAVGVGTYLLRTDEAGTSPAHRRALADASLTETVVTRAFTGRPARALRTGFADRHGDAAPTAYPAVHHLTRPMRRAAAAAGDLDRLHLWAGTGWREAPAVPAAEAIRRLAEGVG